MAGHITSSEGLDWCTPEWIRNGVLKTFDNRLDLDPCSNNYSIMNAEVDYKLPTNDGLKEPWNLKGPGTKVYVNMPFGKSYMKPDRSDIIGAKKFQKLKEQDAIIQYTVTNGSTPAPESKLGKRLHAYRTKELDTKSNFLERLETLDTTSQAAPYSVHTSILDWVKRCVSEWMFNGVEILALLPASTDTKQWQTYLFDNATSACFIKGRIRFLMPDGQPGGPCPMAMALAYFGTSPEKFKQAFEPKGMVVPLDHVWIEAAR